MATTHMPPRLNLGRATLDQVRSVLERELPQQAAGLLREIGFAAGEACFEGFVASVAERYGVETPQALDARYLSEAVGAYLREEGWGTAALETRAPGLVALDSPDWIEAGSRSAATPSCHFSSGMLSDFFTRLGGYPAAVMEVECRSRGDARCRFLIGSPDVLTWIYEGMVAGTAYTQLADQLRTGPKD